MASNTIDKEKKAKPIYNEKSITEEGDIIERRVWEVEKSKDFPHGVKYRLVYIHKGKRVLGYDNERAKQDHKHWFEQEESYQFINDKKLREDFEKDIERMRRELYGN